MSPTFKEELDSATEFIRTNNNKNNRIKLRLGPHAPYTCPDDTIGSIIEKAKELNVGIHIHISETEDQVKNSYKDRGKSPFKVLHDCGAFEVPTIVGHGLWIEKEDLKYIESKDVTFAACPKTYMKLAMKSGGLWEYKEHLNITFGTDGAASSNTLNPIEQARLFGLYGKMNGIAEDYTLEYLWECLMKGHKALSFNTGKVEVGFDADLLVWDLNKVNTTPLYNPLGSIIYSSDSTNIIHTLVQGSFVKYNGDVNLDYKGIIKRVKEIQEDILGRGKGEKKVNY